MNKTSKIVAALVLLIVFSSASFAVDYPESDNERNALQSVRTIRSAEAVFSSSSANGNYGSLRALRRERLITAALAAGNQYGYVFVVTLMPWTPTSPANYTATATPRVYRRSARWSFFVDATGVVHGADKGGEPATIADPVVDECAHGSIVENEECTIRSMRTIHSAEVTYFATSGNGANYTGLAGLASAGLINASLASGSLRGYLISVSWFPQTPTQSARYRATAVPYIYGTTGIRSFYIDETGVIRAADHQGGPANENDPPIVDVNGGSIAENEQSTIASMRTITSAEVAWFATYGYGINYTGLSGLGDAGLIDPVLASGQLHGYSISVIIIPQTPTQSAGFTANAVPQEYGRTGRRSFFVNENGVIYGADHHGGPANENDPPI